MPTVIDALAVTLNLDPSQFRKGQAEAAASWRKTREAAQKEGAGIEKAMDKAGDSFERLIRNGMKLFALFTGGRAVKNFVTDITAADAAIGRLAKSLDTTPEALSALAGAVARGGGSAAGATGSFQKLVNAYNELKLTGRSTTYEMLSRLQAASGKTIRFGNDAKQTIYDIADASKALAERSGTSFASHVLEAAGMDPGTISLLLQGSAKMKEAEERVRRLGGVITKQDIENAQRFQTAMRDVGTVSDGLGRTIWTNLSPAISEIIEKVLKWYEANGQWLRTEISERVKKFADYIREIPWDKINKGIQEFASFANQCAQAIGGWETALKSLLGAWLFLKLAALLRAVGLIRLAITGGAAPGILGSLLAGLGIGGTAALGGILGTSAVTDRGTPNAAKPGVITRSDDENTGAAVAPGGAGRDPRLDRDRGTFRRWWGRTMPTWFGGDSAPKDGIRQRGARGAAARGDQSGGVAANPGAYKDVLDHIARSEGTAHRPGGGYNTSLNYGAYLPGGKEQTLTDKTLDEILALGNHMRRQPGNPNSSALGRYQIVGSTLRDQMRKLGLKGSDLFDEKTQDRIAANLARQRGADPTGLKNEWASLVGAKNTIAVELMRKVDPKASTLPLDRPVTSPPRRPEVLADPQDERRKAMDAGAAEVVAAARAAREAAKPEAGVGPTAQPAGAPKPNASLDAQRSGAMAAIASLNGAQSAMVSRTLNDNRSNSTTTNDTRFNGDFHIYTQANDAKGLMADLRSATKGKAAFAASADYGQV